MLDPQTQTPVPAHFLAKVTYHLHPTFVKHTQVFTEPPFQIQETGWGEFDLKIELQVVEEKGKKMIEHDLNFKAEEYVIDREIVMKNPKPRLLQILGGEGVNGNPGAEGNADGSVLVNGNVGGKGVESARKKKRNERAVSAGHCIYFYRRRLDQLTRRGLFRWTWSDWRTRYRSCRKTTCCTSSNWSTTTRRPRASSRTTSNVS